MCPGLTDRLWGLQDHVAAVEHQQAREDQDEDPQSEASLQGQTRPFSAGGGGSRTAAHVSGGLACLIPQGMLRMEVPIMVFHTAKL